jgi:hypothetical protein
MLSQQLASAVAATMSNGLGDPIGNSRTPTRISRPNSAGLVQIAPVKFDQRLGVASSRRHVVGKPCASPPRERPLPRLVQGRSGTDRFASVDASLQRPDGRFSVGRPHTNSGAWGWVS